MRSPKTTFLMLSAFVCLLALSGQIIEAGGRAQEAASDLAPGAAANHESQPLSIDQARLLDLAERAANAIPSDPHLKDRSRMQALVVETALQLNQPQRALQLIPKISNWRRGTCYADLALYHAKHLQLEDAERCLANAQHVADATNDWRRDTVLVKITIVKNWLGRSSPSQIDSLESGMAESEVGKVDAGLALKLDESAFDGRVKDIDALLATQHFDMVRNALSECAQLHRRFYTNAYRRALMETTIRNALPKMPVAVRLELLMELCRTSLEHNDRSRALLILNEAQVMLDASNWVPEDLVPIQAKLIGLRHEAGEQERAGRDAAALLSFYQQQRDRIVDVFRAAALRPLAETHGTRGDSSAALKVYTLAIEEGAVNPNARPRAEDLVATCCSMALRNTAPDEHLWSVMHRIVEGLRDPW